MMKVLFLFVLSIVLLAIEATPKSAGGEQMREKRFLGGIFMYPGTKWCGPGHIAKSWYDLGRHRASDKCCRFHDRKCNLRIRPYQKKYGLWNGLKVKSGCHCEKTFMKCLKKVKTQASRNLFNIYFKFLKPECIKLKTVKYRKCIKRSWWVCKKYKTFYKKKAFVYNLQKEMGI